jgi:hypothetical protein
MKCAPADSKFAASFTRAFDKARLARDFHTLAFQMRMKPPKVPYPPPPPPPSRAPD